MIESTVLPPEMDAQLKAHFERSQQFFSSLGSARPQALILGGSYGRGEGGVARRADGQPCFYNDLDYFVFTPQPRDRGLQQAVHEWERRETEQMGVEVEAKCLSLSQLRDGLDSIMFFDLVLGHRVVLGPEDFLQPYRTQLSPQQIAPLEATRLLWNRGSGLLFARLDLAQGIHLEQVHRNQNKLELALGDALLALRGRYQPTVRARQIELERLAGVDPELQARYAQAVAFKLAPSPAPGLEQLQRRQQELTELWRKIFLELESARLGQPLHSAERYIQLKSRLFPDSSVARNLLLGLRDRLRRGGGLQPRWDYPRAALQRALLALLEPQPNFSQVRQFLGAGSGSLPAAVQLYRRWWGFYS